MRAVSPKITKVQCYICDEPLDNTFVYVEDPEMAYAAHKRCVEAE